MSSRDHTHTGKKAQIAANDTPTESKDETIFDLAGPPILESGQIDDPPDGGMSAWINVSCSCALMFTVFGFRTS